MPRADGEFACNVSLQRTKGQSTATALKTDPKRGRSASKYGGDLVGRRKLGRFGDGGWKRRSKRHAAGPMGCDWMKLSLSVFGFGDITRELRSFKDHEWQISGDDRVGSCRCY